MTSELKTLLDRPILPGQQLLDKIVVELSRYLNPIELDMIIDRMALLSNSKYDVNWSVTDCATYISGIIGQDRYARAKELWVENNQKMVTAFGRKKYKHKQTKELFDGLDPEDDSNNYDIVYI